MRFIHNLDALMVKICHVLCKANMNKLEDISLGELRGQIIA
jgi:hypothetical protein